MRTEIDGAIERAAATLASSRYAVALTGAGASVESGVPTFRGPDGLWTRHGAPEPDSYARFRSDPAAWWRREAARAVDPYIIELRTRLAAARPNAAHVALARLERAGVVKTLITQNIDGLHAAAGSRKVVEIHGSRHRMRCIQCGDRTPRESLFVRRAPPPCRKCGGLVKYDSVLFGEPIPRAVLAECRAETDRADCMLVAGTSASVRPAGGLPRIARANGAALIEVNTGETPLSSICDIVLRGPAGSLLPRLADAVEAALERRAETRPPRGGATS